MAGRLPRRRRPAVARLTGDDRARRDAGALPSRSSVRCVTRRPRAADARVRLTGDGWALVADLRPLFAGADLARDEDAAARRVPCWLDRAVCRPRRAVLTSSVTSSPAAALGRLPRMPRLFPRTTVLDRILNLSRVMADTGSRRQAQQQESHRARCEPLAAGPRRAAPTGLARAMAHPRAATKQQDAASCATKWDAPGAVCSGALPWVQRPEGLHALTGRIRRRLYVSPVSDRYIEKSR
jgi:hypothetical protein